MSVARLPTVLAMLIALVAGSAVLAIDAENGFEDPALNARYRALIDEIRCMK